MLAQDIKKIFRDSARVLSSIPGVYVNEAAEYRSSPARLSRGRFGLRLVTGDAACVSYDVHWFLKQLFQPLQASPHPVRVALLFKGWGPREIATIVVDIESVYWDSSDYPRIDLLKSPAIVNEFLGGGGFWGGFVLAIARMPPDTMALEKLDPTLAIFTGLVRAWAVA